MKNPTKLGKWEGGEGAILLQRKKSRGNKLNVQPFWMCQKHLIVTVKKYREQRLEGFEKTDNANLFLDVLMTLRIASEYQCSL